MSSTKMFMTVDLRPCVTLSAKQRENVEKYMKPIPFKNLTKSQQELVYKVYVDMDDPNGKKFTKKALENDEYVNVFQFCVKTDFLEKCPNPENQQTEELFQNFNMSSFVHNETGPALINMVADRQEFYINGKEVDAEMAKKMQHNNQFVTKFDKLLNEA